MEDELLYRGRFNHIGDRKLNSIRLFVSSTFTGMLFPKITFKGRYFFILTSDTTEERNGLIDRVYPRLREYCLAKYKIQFQVIFNFEYIRLISIDNSSIRICVGVYNQQPHICMKQLICACKNSMFAVDYPWQPIVW